MAIQPARKRRRLSPPGLVSSHTASASPDPSDPENEDILDSSFAHRAVKWNLEQDYEKRPRKQKEKESLRLPIKTAEGRIEHVVAPTEADDDVSDSESSQQDVESEAPAQDEQQDQPKLSHREQIVAAKEDLARIANLINEDPEDRIGSLRTLAEITASENPTVTKLGLVTQLAVYKDLIPGYRIRPLSDEDLRTKLSKDIRKLRNFEQAIVSNYQRYVKELARIAALVKNSPSADAESLSTVAVSCAGNLLNAAPHFNFRSDLVRILVDKLGAKARGKDFDTSLEALQNLFANDDEGNASLDAVSMLAKMMKSKNYRIDERVLNLFLHLRLLSEFSHKASTTNVEKDEEDNQQPRGKKTKQKREHRSKKERKLAREHKSIEKEMKEADAVVSHEQRDKNQAETLKLVFVVYFRILKARTPSLMGPVLEGLVKYAHLINQDFFGDLLESLKDLINESETSEHDDEQVDADREPSNNAQQDDSRDTARESLLCVITAFALLEGQDGASAVSTLHLDLNFFITHLYRTLHLTALNADLELSAKSQHLPDPHAAASIAAPRRTKVNVQTTIVLLLRSLQFVLLPTNTRTLPPLRLAAFAKQILTAALHMPEKSCTAMLGLMRQVLKLHRRKVTALWNTEERRGDGVFDPLRGTVEGSNPFAATVWEGELLRLHWAPNVREAVKGLEAVVSES